MDIPTESPAPPVDWRKARLDRDLGWLEFNRRVLHEALDSRTPLLERAKFLAIFSSNLDEFFMKRIGVFRRRLATLPNTRTAEAEKAATHLRHLREIILPMLEQQARCFREELLPQLAEYGIRLLSWEQLDDALRSESVAFFERNVSPALIPLALDPGHPFPYLSNLSCSLGFSLQNPESEEPLFARVKVPNILPAWVELRGGAAPGQRTFVGLHEVIRHNAHRLFPGMEVASSTFFRVTRNADIELDDEDAESLRALVTEELRQRRFAPVVRLELGPQSDPWVAGLLMRQFELTEDDVYRLPAEIDYTGLWQIAGLGLPEISDPIWTPVVPTILQDEQTDIFAVIRSRDLLVHHPYECFDASVEHFIRHAADDPDVVAIKMTVYRVGDDTPFVRSLIRAAESGKQVACLIELQARFDEERNLHWAHELEAIGAHVVHGVVGLKTHTQFALVVRTEAEGLRCYAHIGTGN